MEKLTKEIVRLTLNEGLKKVGVVYDFRMNDHKPQRDHPERPARLSSIIEHFDSTGLLKHCEVISTCKEATLDQALLIHPKKYLDMVEKTCKSVDEDSLWADTYTTPESNTAAFLALDALVKCVDNVQTKKWDSAFAVVRPPGHHANTHDECLSGFCIYNNVAVAAKYLQKTYPEVKKILIFDWDVHHGDSTQKFFLEDESILYVSLHRFEGGAFYPGRSGDIKNIGENKGKHFNINAPWNINSSDSFTAGDNEYVYIMERVIMPICKKFQPDFVFISAGFDSAWGDPLGSLSLSPNAYSYMTERLKSLNQKIVVALEGGYNLKSISQSAEYTLRTLLGQSMPITGEILSKATLQGVYDGNPSVEHMINKCRPNVIAWGLAKQLNFYHSVKWESLTNKENELFDTNITNYDKEYRKNYVDEPHFIPVLFEKAGKYYCNHEEKSKPWFKGALNLPEKMKSFHYNFGGEETVDDVKYLSFTNNIGDLKKASYWIASFTSDSKDGEGQICNIATTHKLVIRDSQGNITELFDDRFDYGWNYKFDVDTLSHLKYIWKRLYYSGGNTKPGDTCFEIINEALGDLVDFVVANETEVRDNLKLMFAVDHSEKRYNVFYMNPEEFKPKNGGNHLMAAQGVKRLHNRIKTAHQATS
jgi:histone deacetylase 6